MMPELFDEFITELKAKDASQIKQELNEMETEGRSAEKVDKRHKGIKVDEKLFDYVIGNPPYQIDVSKGKKRSTNTRNSKDIFPDFHKLSAEISDNVTMIYPATWQKKITTGFGGWLFDNGLKSAYNYDVCDVFGGAVEKGILVSVISASEGYTGDVVANGSPRPRSTPVWINSEKDYIVYKNTSTWGGEFLSGAAYITKLSNIDRKSVV